MSQSNTLVIPGTKIEPSPFGNRRVTTSKVQQNPIFFGSEGKNKLLPPLVLAFREGESITVELLYFAQYSKHLKVEDFSFFYDFGLDVQGGYELIIYITYDKGNSGEEGFAIDLFEGSILFEKGSYLINDTEIDPAKISTVKAFFVEKDPETSRGTETTVQEGG